MESQGFSSVRTAIPRKLLLSECRRLLREMVSVLIADVNLRSGQKGQRESGVMQNLHIQGIYLPHIYKYIHMLHMYVYIHILHCISGNIIQYLS